MVNPVHRLVYAPPQQTWSGGGKAVLSNLSLVESKVRARAAVIVPRNYVPPQLLVGGNYVYMPQNAWPWSPYSYGREELVRRSALRCASWLGEIRCLALVRMSRAIPPPTRSVPQIVLPNVLDVGFESQLRKAQAVQESPFRGKIACIGSIDSYRNLDVLIPAHQRYLREGGSKALRIQGVPGSRAYLKRIGLQAQRAVGVEFVPRPLPRYWVLAALRDAFSAVFPSLVEASPLGVLEGLVLNGRVYLSDIPGHRDTVDDGLPEGQFFDPRQRESIVRALTRAENREPEARLAEGIRTPEQRKARRLEWADELSGFLTTI